MYKHQIQIRAVTQLYATRLTVADDNKVRVTGTAIERPGATVLGHQLLPGQRQHMLQYHLGQIRQTITDPHQRQRSSHLTSRHLETIHQAEIAQHLHLLFQVIDGDAQLVLTQLILQLGLAQRTIETIGVQQLIQQQRVAREIIGDPRAGATEGHQLLQGGRIFQ